MPRQINLLIPLACALIYVVGALAIKRAAALGVGVWRTSFLSNWAVALLFAPAWLWADGPARPLLDYAQPAVAGVLFLGGQVLTFLALSRGDVSVVAPVMGTKVLLVALVSSLLRVGTVPLPWWIAAALSTAGIGLLHLGEVHGPRGVGRTAGLAAASAASFSVGDVLMQKWLPAWGAGNFLPPMFLLVGVFSFTFVPFFSAPLRALGRPAWRWVGPGALLLAVNNGGVAYAIGRVGSATAVNIVYSLRGLFSVAVVWAVGHWFASDEHHLTRPVVRCRLAGAALMAAAVGLVLL